MAKEEPKSAWIKFSLYREMATAKKGHEALAALAAAVALDRVYALEYPLLAKMVYNAGRKDEALRMISLAAESFPENSSLKLQQAQLAFEIGEINNAREIVEDLKKRPWSQEYYPGMLEYLAGFSQNLDQATRQ